MSKKKIYTLLLLVAAAGWVCFALLVLAALGAKGKESVMTSTETRPIYDHFPDLPEASEIQWCSRTSGGIGPSMVRLYIFAFYAHGHPEEVCQLELTGARRASRGEVHSSTRLTMISAVNCRK